MMTGGIPGLEGPVKKAWVVSAMMGLGHMRAAHALRDLGEIVIEGSSPFCPPHEYMVWKRLRHVYYFLSRAEQIPLVGKQIFKLLYSLQQIPSYYPRRDLSAPSSAVRYLYSLIEKGGLCRTLVETIDRDALPVINTFYATSMAIDALSGRRKGNYLLICDSDCNRVWVSAKPKESTIKYLAPCTRVKMRLLSYGVPEENIFHTGFPLPKENIGSEKKLEVLKEDLFNRLARLDPSLFFFNIYGRTVEYYLERKPPQEKKDLCFTLTFAVGGSGAQSEMAYKILKSLRTKIKEGKIKVNLSAGIRKEVYAQFQENIASLKLGDCLDKGVSIIHDEDIYGYFEKFNRALRATDVLWTKPSELSFYCALGIPILMAPTVGTQEELNSRWLQDVHAGVKPAGPIENTDEWLFDLRNTGILAEAAWDGFLKGRKLGTYKIEELVNTGKFTLGNSPLER
ncbi:MAG: DUF6938 domain-containing protein [Endomicrobiales bacterium]